MNGNASSGNSAGAIYFITNEPSGNFIMAGDIGSDGKITFSNAVPTQGKGSHGVVDPNGPDGLFSQGAVKASAANNMLATVNAGSNTVSLFSIDPQNPSNLKQVGQPVCSGGEFPVSVAFNKNGTQLCALNSGASNGVNCYTVDQQNGLTALPNTMRSLGLNQTTPPTGPPNTPSHLVFTEDGSKLVASVKGTPPNSPGFLAVWDVAADGSLSENFTSITPATGGLLPFSLTNIAGKNAVLATDAGIGFDIFDFSGSGAQLNASSKNSANAIDGQSATCWSSQSKKTGNFYLTDIGTSTVTEVNVDENLKGTIVKQYPQQNNSATIDNDIAQVNGKDFLYVLAANATSVDVLSLDAPGEAQNVGSFNFADAAKQAGLTISPNNVQGMTSFIKA
ncbi:hypothetical protein K474DRAFT_1586866 [Panus rudis PR-1116 ss-1]|nr:hypothetical protein K474DRAFT_1586866 [Panus rudis PR-1116 ss-1]